MANSNADTLNEEAAAWFVRMQHPRVSSADRAAFDQWMDDPARAVAYIRVEAAWDRSERLRAVPVSSSPQSASRAPAMTRRAAAAAIVLGSGVAAAVALGGRTAYSTAIGERKSVRLADGTHINLNTASRIEVDYSGTNRRIKLTAGEALFDVAKDPSRPFVVKAADASVRALGTIFNVRLRGVGVEVTVAEGAVAVSGAVDGPADNAPSKSRVAAGQAALIGPGAVAEVSLDADTLQRRVVWTEGVIDLHGETLEEAVQEFNRYSKTQLVVGDPAIASIRVGGTFETHESEKFVSALEAGFGVHAVRGDGAVYILGAQK